MLRLELAGQNVTRKNLTMESQPHRQRCWLFQLGINLSSCISLGNDRRSETHTHGQEPYRSTLATEMKYKVVGKAESGG